MITPEIVSENFRKAVQWLTEMEKAILEHGQPLLLENRRDAQAIGIQRIDDVRLVMLDTIPLPNDPGLKQLAVETGLITDTASCSRIAHTTANSSPTN